MASQTTSLGPGSSANAGPGSDGSTVTPFTPAVSVPEHELLSLIGSGAYGEVWLARSIVGNLRAVKVVRRNRFSEAYPFEREFKGIQKYVPVSRSTIKSQNLLGTLSAERFLWNIYGQTFS